MVRGLRFWVGLSGAIHLLILLLVILDILPQRRLPEPEEAIPVELIAPIPAQMAEGEVLAPTPAPPVPDAPTAEQIPTPPVPNQPITPPPPPPPPPPAPQQASAPPQPQRPQPPTPAPPPPPPAPSAIPLPPVPPPPPQVAENKPPQPQTPPPPTPAPQRPTPPSNAPAPPEPSREAGTGRTPTPQRPQERSQSVLNTLERLRGAQQQEAPRARANPGGAPTRGGGVPQGTDQLTGAERTGLADRIGECWAVDAGAPNLSSVIVELRVEVDAGGTVRVVRPNGAIPADPRARMVYEAARRALLDPRCNPLPLPPARLSALRDAVFRFNPRDLGLR